MTIDSPAQPPESGATTNLDSGEVRIESSDLYKGGLTVTETEVALVMVSGYARNLRRQTRFALRAIVKTDFNFSALIRQALEIGKGTGTDKERATHNGIVARRVRDMIREMTVGIPDSQGNYPTDSPVRKALTNRQMQRDAVVGGIAQGVASVGGFSHADAEAIANEANMETTEPPASPSP